jgi:uncharacterized membrane protein
LLIKESKMDKTQSILAAAIGGLLVAGLVGNAAASEMKMEKCYGVAKAGKNDCGSKAAGHSCAGQASKSEDGNDFVSVPKGTCDKLAHGSTESSGAMVMPK